MHLYNKKVLIFIFLYLIFIFHFKLLNDSSYLAKFVYLFTSGLLDLT